MKKPTALKVVVIVAWLQVAQAILAFFAAASCVVIPAREGFWLGFQNAAASGLSSALDARSFGPEQFGEATAHVVIAAMFPIGALSCIKKRKKGGLIAFVAIGLVVALSQHSIPLLSFVALIAACRSSVAEFFRQASEPIQPSQTTTGSSAPDRV